MFAFFLKKIEGLSDRKTVKKIAEIVFSVAHLGLGKMPGKSRCPVCGARLVLISRPVVSKELASASNYDDKWIAFFNQREGEICISCGASLRARQLACALLRWGSETQGLDGASAFSMMGSDGAKRLRLAEVNSCGALHKALEGLPGLKFSEYEPEDSSVPHEDLLNLSYASGEFDMVLHSDTLEHVPDIKRALGEIHRVLKPGGATIFTIPAVRDGRKTVARATLKNDGEIEHLMPPVYHGGSYQKTCQYLVFYEFGDDFKDMLGNMGFTTTILEHPSNPSAFVITAIKPL